MWWGYCHGWSPAALNYKEPKPVTLANPQGIKVPFGSSDVKALLTFSQQYRRAPADTHNLGARCNFDIHNQPAHADDPECRDTNAGAFHVVVANMLGVKKTGFVADVTRDEQVWNQPVFGFSSEIVAQSSDVYANAAPGTVSIAEIKTTMRYISEFGPRWNPTPFDTFPAQIAQAQYHYTVELNAAGEVIGGEWLDDNRPDFLWTQTAPVFAPTDYFSKVADVYAAATTP
jgi:hypothetical protein